MLRTLSVRDLAIIDELELLLEPGLNVITGETGAGKSILLQALDLVLGGRSDTDLIRTGADEALVEAQFSEIPALVRDQLAAAGITIERDELVVRRVVARGGRTRLYLNGSLSSLAAVREIAPHLLHAYGQDEHQALRRVESHRELLDQGGGLARMVGEMHERYARFEAARVAVERCRSEQAQRAERTELLQFQLSELERAALVAGEEEALTSERARLVHAERLSTLVRATSEAVYAGEGAVVDVLGRARGSLQEAERLDGDLTASRTLLEAALAELEEVGSTLGRYLDQLAPDPERLETVEDRLAQIARLKRKYGGAVEDLIRRQEELTKELAGAGQSNERLAALETEANLTRRQANEWAGRLSVERRRVALDLERKLGTELRGLALEEARVSVRFAEGERPLGPEGRDEVEFFLAANPGEEPRSLARVASGGELSRIMLALKTLGAAEEQGAALLFDEVDAGIGGATAEIVGRKLKQLGRNRQVLCITHLALIAAFADHHVGVAKRQRGGRTISAARPLSTNERVLELARMLGGAKVTREVREHAEKLLRDASEKERLRGRRTHVAHA